MVEWRGRCGLHRIHINYMGEHKIIELPAREVRINGNLLIYHHTLLDISSSLGSVSKPIITHVGN